MGGAPRADECWYERMTSVYVRYTRDHERWADCLKLDLQDFLGISGMGGATLAQVRSCERLTSDDESLREIGGTV